MGMRGYGYSSFLMPGMGYGMGYGYGGYGMMGGGPSLFSIVFYMAVAAFLFQFVRSLSSGGGDGGASGILGGSDSDKIAVAKLQVALLGSARALQKDLDRIAARADTSTPSGLYYVLEGA